MIRLALIMIEIQSILLACGQFTVTVMQPVQPVQRFTVEVKTKATANKTVTKTKGVQSSIPGVRFEL